VIGLKTASNGSTTSGELKFRHELKCLIHDHTAASLKNALTGLLPLDRHSDENGGYNIRSLYFDDPRENALYEKISGLSDRGKFRIRIYNLSSSVIHLEYKEKKKNLVRKHSATLTMEEAMAAMACEPSTFLQSDDALKRRFGTAMARGLKPAQLVDYRREAFLYPLGNVRITLDRGLCAPLGLDLFETRYPSPPALPPHMNILEIKYDAFIPQFLQNFLHSNPMALQAQSKYALCRIAPGSTGVLRVSPYYKNMQNQ